MKKMTFFQQKYLKVGQQIRSGRHAVAKACMLLIVTIGH